MSSGIIKYMSLKPVVFSPPLNVNKVIDEAGVQKMFEFFDRCDKIIGWDIETTCTDDYFYRRCRTMQFGNIQEQYVIDLLAFCDNHDVLQDCQGHYGRNLHLAPRLKSLLERLQEKVLGNNVFLKCGVNLSFEYETTRWNFGLRPWNFFSTDLVERVIVAGAHSLKQYSYFSMEEMVARYFGLQVDKELQTSFNLTDPLSNAQYEYAAADTRLPLALRLAQVRIINKDGLVKAADIENNAIGAFQDMHVHGERLDREAWKKRTALKQKELLGVIDELDTHFIPLVGDKNVVITDEQIAKADAEWKQYNIVAVEETILRKQIKYEKDKDAQQKLKDKLLSLESDRKEKKEHFKTIAHDLKKKRTKVNKLIAKCEGQALINYGSNAQLFETLTQIKALKKLKDTNDDTLVKFKHVPIIKVLRKYRELSKQIDTYGDQWVTEWITKAGKKEGWLNPGDGRLHSTFNQLDAETGRSTSEKPNGQNLPQDKMLRACFIADPPDEEEPEGYVIVTADMSGAELRIIAELANAKTWIDAFNRGEDVHSVGTEMMYPEKWPACTIKSLLHPEGWTLEDTKTERIPLYNVDGSPILKDGKPVCVPPCAFYAKKPNGEFAREKCDCPEHKLLRDGNKSTNFLLAYGGTAFTLAERLDVSKEEAVDLMTKHEYTFPDIWAYLEDSGKSAKFNKESRDMFGRRRLFPTPTWERATEKAKEDREEKLRFPEPVQEKKINDFIAINGRKPTKEEKYILTHRLPTSSEIANAYAKMHESIERQGKNSPIQASNASIAKLAMGWGRDEKQNKPYLWHTLPLYKAKLLKFVHDELVVQCPKRYGKIVAELIGDAFLRAGAERMTKVQMLFDYKIGPHWMK